MNIDLIKIILPTALSFFIGILITPVFSKYLYSKKLWKKNSRAQSDGISEQFKSVHENKRENSTPRPGGILIWSSVSFVIILFYIISLSTASPVFDKLSFLSRNQTLVPLGALILGALIGLVDDIFQIIGKGDYAKDDIKHRTIKVIVLLVIGALIGSWFYFKLGISSIDIPFGGILNFGWFFIPFFMIVMLAVWSTSVIDGIDGLSGGVLASVFAAYTTIAFFNNQIDLAAFCGAITGGILAFLWFNIPPARFYMGETGMLALTVLLAVVAFLTDTVLVLPIIALPLVLTTLSVIIQMLSRRFRNGKKVFLVSPLHHHFEALGWPSYKVTMRFWIISIVFAITGMIIVFLG